MLGSVNDVSFSSDGRRLLGAGGDKRLLVWNTASGQVRTACVRNVAALEGTCTQVKQ
jgi:WD40 repeat protein